ncbi:MAG: TRAP transporter substrate-binding protein DctP [Chloroflexi bacterium]|nr:TRAP transporter substrate-binding protein DctP [Chloroflexota bacterium]
MKRARTCGVFVVSLLLAVSCSGGSAIREPAKPESKPAQPAPPASSAGQPSSSAAPGAATAPQPAAATKPTAAAAAPGATVWNLPTIFNQSDYQLGVLQKLTAKVKEKSAGRLDIRIHPSSSLYGLFDIGPAVIDGRVEIASIPTTGISDAKPQLAIGDLPYVAATDEQGRKVADALVPYYKREAERSGLVLLITLPWPNQNLYTVKQPVRTVDEWKNLKIRSYSVESADFVRAMGASPVTIPSGELYVGMQRGLAEGGVTSTMFIQSTKVYEVIKFANLWAWNPGPQELVSVNKKAWDALPADLQKVITDVIAEEKLLDEARELRAGANDKALKFIMDNGVQRVDVAPAEIEKAKELSKKVVWANWLKRAGSVGEEAVKIAEEAVR